MEEADGDYDCYDWDCLVSDGGRGVEGWGGGGGLGRRGGGAEWEPLGLLLL